MSGNGLFIEYCAKDFLDGTQLLDPWEELAYRRICDMIYATNNNLPDDDKKLGWMTKAGKRWPAIKKVLLDRDKIQIVDGKICNERCTKALAKSAKNIAQKVGASAAAIEARNQLKKHKRHSPAGRAADKPDGGSDGSHNQEPNNPNKNLPVVPDKKRRRIFFAEDQEMTPEFAEVAAGYVMSDIGVEWGRFRDWHAKKGEATLSAKASYRTWLEKAVEFGRAMHRPKFDLLTEMPKQAIIESREVRDWRNRLITSESQNGFWAPSWGPKPGARDCEVPPALLKEYPYAGKEGAAH